MFAAQFACNSPRPKGKRRWKISLMRCVPPALYMGSQMITNVSMVVTAMGTRLIRNVASVFVV